MKEKIIDYFENSFEAEWQLVKFEQTRYIDTIMSTNCDLFIVSLELKKS